MRKFKFTLDNGKSLTIQPPTVRMYYKGLMTAKSDPQLFQSIAEICSRNDEGIRFTEEKFIDNFTTDDFSRFMSEFPKWVQKTREADPN